MNFLLQLWKLIQEWLLTIARKDVEQDVNRKTETQAEELERKADNARKADIDTSKWL